MRHDDDKSSNFHERDNSFLLKLKSLSYRKLRSLGFFHNNRYLLNKNYEYKKINNKDFIEFAIQEKTPLMYKDL